MQILLLFSMLDAYTFSSQLDVNYMLQLLVLLVSLTFGKMKNPFDVYFKNILFKIRRLQVQDNQQVHEL